MVRNRRSKMSHMNRALAHMNWALGLGALTLLVGCTNIRTTQQYEGGPLPRPGRVWVSDFAVTPDEVELDRGLSARVYEAAKGTPRSEQEIEIGQKVASGLSDELVKKIRKLGMMAEHASELTEPAPNDVMIEGQFVSIDEGNRTERTVIGLGLGRTEVEAEVQVLQNGRTVEQFETDAKSSRKPGMAETMGVGAAAGNLAVAAVASTAVAVGSEAFSANVEADASRTAGKLAGQLSVFFVRQGWIPAEAANSGL